ncbi:Ger(x)C family spore germination protein [Clostridium felsineum]|uniref:Ger(x)C family spore germination protein n=1 Tax=Clostridium felsineum TaxID=36839 RepID=UPI00098C4971|nr:Ger(x)C family spore germination protein [Clostridium felsineum]URZ18479.1 Spore germination protein A3 [Clostridium felsineum DSM 794]
MKKALLILIIIMNFTLVGCWDSTETEKLGVVTLIGFQLTQNNNIKVTLQEVISKNQSSGNSSSSTNGSPPFHVYCGEGSTIYDVLQKISASEYQKIYFAHTKAIIVDETLARKRGIADIVDFYQRTTELRPRTWLLISKSGELDKIITTDITSMDTGSLMEEIVNNRNQNSYMAINNMKDFMFQLNDSQDAAYTSGISMMSEGKSNKFVLKDAAIFKNYKLIDWFNTKETRGLSLGTNNIKGGYISVPFNSGMLSLSILKTKLKVHPVINKNKIQMDLHLDVLSNISESSTKSSFIDENTIKKIQMAENTYIKNEILSSIETSQSINADVFNFGNYINEYYPRVWEKIEKDWYSFYPKLKINVSVDSKIQNIGKSYKSLYK